MSHLPSLAVFFVLCTIAASSGAVFSPGPWYDTLAKPSWTPPQWVFPTVWTILYIMIAIAGWLVWRAQGPGTLLWIWGLQLVLNAAWSAIMFGAQRVGWAFVELTALWLSVALFTVLAWTQVPTAAYLFLPYLAWVTAAGALNWGVLRLNP